jgi:hypothetical protein
MIAINAQYGYLTREKASETLSSVVPPGLFFAIWGVIYSGLASIYVLLWYIYYNGLLHYIQYNGTLNCSIILFYLNIVHILNSLWIILNNLSKESIKKRLLLQTIVIYLMGYFLLLTYKSTNSTNYVFNILIGNVIALYLGWVVCASFLSTILTIYEFYPNIDKVSKYLGFVWIAIAIKYFVCNYDIKLLDISIDDIYTVYETIQPMNYGFYGAVLWGLVGVLLS